MYVRVHVRVRLRVHLYVCVPVYVCVFVCFCEFLHLFTNFYIFIKNMYLATEIRVLDIGRFSGLKATSSNRSGTFLLKI